ncbi:MAG: hypothetical protein ACTSR8_17130 [Promethearchaeota archaeon]
MTLQPMEILSGSLSLAAVLLSFFIGLKIAFSYFKHKRQEFLLVGITGIILTEPWWGSAVSLILALITGDGLDSIPYFIISNIFIPIGIIFWLVALGDLMFEKHKKQLFILGIIYAIVFETIFLTSLILNPSSIGFLKTKVDVEYHFLMMGVLFSIVIFVVITGFIFARQSLKSDNPEIRFRGKMMLFGFSSFAVGATMDAILDLTWLTLIIARLILMICAISLYGGFIMPDWMKKLCKVSS